MQFIPCVSGVSFPLSLLFSVFPCLSLSVIVCVSVSLLWVWCSSLSPSYLFTSLFTQLPSISSSAQHVSTTIFNPLFTRLLTLSV